MDRRAALILLAAVALAKKPQKAEAPKKKASAAIHVRSIDLARRYVLIELAGVSRPPAPNLFTMTDERGRHYVALGITCDPPFPSGARACELLIPDGYERHKLVKLELHMGGLHSRTIAAPEGEIATAWDAAQAARVEPPKAQVATAPSPSPSPKPASKPSAAAPKPSPRPSPAPRK